MKEQAPAAEKGFSMLTAALKKRITIHRKTEKKRKDNAEKTRPRKTMARKTKAKKKKKRG